MKTTNTTLGQMGEGGFNYSANKHAPLLLGTSQQDTSVLQGDSPITVLTVLRHH